ncbi:MAG TPA: hypothetical protein VIV12_28340, partial [Streptosporangiaceae bacterium]
MMFPLLVMALAWDKLHLGERTFLRARLVRIRFAGRTLVTNTINIAVAAGFTVMGGFVIYLASAGQMTGGPGFQVAIGRALGRLFRNIEIWFKPVPEPVLGAALLALAALFVVAALRRRTPGPSSAPNARADDAALFPAPGKGADMDHSCHPPVRNH